MHKISSEGDKGKTKKRSGEKDDSRKRKRTALEELREVSIYVVFVPVCMHNTQCACMQMEEQRKEKMNRRDNWIAEVIFYHLYKFLHTHTHRVL